MRLAERSDTWRLAGHVSLLFLAFTTYGLLQEKVMTGTFGPDHVTFRASPLLVLLTRVLNIVMAASLLSFLPRSHQLPLSMPIKDSSLFAPSHPLYAYFAIALCNFLSTTAQYEALTFISFTMSTLGPSYISIHLCLLLVLKAVIGKCAKMLPVMALGTLLNHKSYPTSAYVAAICVLLGCACLLQSSGSSARGTAQKSHSHPLGLLLIGAYLCFDALTSVVQERLFRQEASARRQATEPLLEEAKVSHLVKIVEVCRLSFYVNLFAASIALFVCWSHPHVSEATQLLLSQRDLQWLVLGLCFSSSVGQFLLVALIQYYGALTAATVMTVRQFTSICVNALAFGIDRIGTQGWCGIAIAAIGVGYKQMDALHRQSLSAK